MIKKKTVAVEIQYDGIYCGLCNMIDTLFLFYHIYQSRENQLLCDKHTGRLLRCKECLEDLELVLVLDTIQYAEKMNTGRIYPRRKFGVGATIVVKELRIDENGVMNIIPLFITWNLVSELNLIDKNCVIKELDK